MTETHKQYFDLYLNQLTYATKKEKEFFYCTVSSIAKRHGTCLSHIWIAIGLFYLICLGMEKVVSFFFQKQRTKQV